MAEYDRIVFQTYNLIYHVNIFLPKILFVQTSISSWNNAYFFLGANENLDLYDHWIDRYEQPMQSILHSKILPPSAIFIEFHKKH